VFNGGFYEDKFEKYPGFLETKRIWQFLQRKPQNSDAGYSINRWSYECKSTFRDWSEPGDVAVKISEIPGERWVVPYDGRVDIALN
jgi:hypothetical protein